MDLQAHNPARFLVLTVFLCSGTSMDRGSLSMNASWQGATEGKALFMGSPDVAGQPRWETRYLSQWPCGLILQGWSSKAGPLAGLRMPVWLFSLPFWPELSFITPLNLIPHFPPPHCALFNTWMSMSVSLLLHFTFIAGNYKLSAISWGLE